MTRRFGVTFCCASLLLLATSSHGGGFTIQPDANDYFTPKAITAETNWFIGAGGGIDSTMFSDKTLSLITNSAGNPADSFTMSNISKIDSMFHVFTGYRWKMSDSAQYVSLQLEYDYFSKVSVNGTRLAFGPGGTPTSYHYNLQRQAFLLLGKVALFQWNNLLPYLEIGAGVSQIEFSNFSNPNAFFTIRPFPNYTSYHFAAVAGLGFDWMAAKSLAISIGYRFGYWGAAESGEVTQSTATPPPPNTLPAPVRLSHTLYSNQGIVNATYLFS